MLLASFTVENFVFCRRKQKLNTGLNPDLQSRIRLTSRELKVIYFLVFMEHCYLMTSQQPVVQSSCASKSYSESLYIMTIWGRFELQTPCYRMRIQPIRHLSYRWYFERIWLYLFILVTRRQHSENFSKTASTRILLVLATQIDLHRMLDLVDK